MIDILKMYEDLFVLEENGQNVLLKDCLKYRISKQERGALYDYCVCCFQKDGFFKSSDK